MKLQPGQVLIGRQELSRVLKLSERNTRTALKLLKTTGITTSETTSHFSIITLVKWVDYQGQPHKVTSETTGEVTNSRPTADQQVTTEQEVKNERMKENPGGKPPIEDSATPQDPKTSAYIAAWIDAWKLYRAGKPWIFESRAAGRLKNILAGCTLTVEDFSRRAKNYLTNPKRQSGFTMLDFVETLNKWDVPTVLEGSITPPAPHKPIKPFHLPEIPPDQQPTESLLESFNKAKRETLAKKRGA